MMPLDKGEGDPDDCNCVNCKLERIGKILKNMETCTDKMIKECAEEKKDRKRKSQKSK